MPRDRMPPIAPEEMTDAQRGAAAALAAGPRGAVLGPFVPLLRSPELMNRLQKVGEYLRFQSALGPRLTELAILWVARRHTQQVEWAIHEPLARKNGIAPEVVAALADGRRPGGLAEDEAVVCDLLEELWANDSVSDPTFHRAVASLGERRLVDLLGLAGYYSLLSMVMNVARTPVPDGAPAPLERFPR